MTEVEIVKGATFIFAILWFAAMFLHIKKQYRGSSWCFLISLFFYAASLLKWDGVLSYLQGGG